MRFSECYFVTFLRNATVAPCREQKQSKTQSQSIHELSVCA